MNRDELAWLLIRYAGVLMIVYSVVALLYFGIFSYQMAQPGLVPESFTKEQAAQFKSSYVKSALSTLATQGSYSILLGLFGVYFLFDGRLVFRMVTRDASTESR